MGNKKDIGKAFREKLDHLDKSPSENLWAAIHADLQKKKKRRFIFIPFWMKTVGIFSLAAVLSLFVFNKPLRDRVFSRPDRTEQQQSAAGNDDTNPIVSKSNKKTTQKTDQNATDVNPNANPESTTDKASEENTAIAVSGSDSPDAANFTNPNSKAKTQINKTGKNHKSTIAFKESHSEKNRRLALKGKAARKRQANKQLSATGKTGEKTGGETPKEIVAPATNPTFPENKFPITNPNTKPAEETPISKIDSLKTKNETAPKPPSKKEKDSTKIIEINRINIFAYASPTYIGLLSKKSPFDSRLNYNATKSEVSWSYGAYASYEASPKWSLRFGIAKTSTKLTTENAPVDISPAYSDINYTHFSNAAVYSMSNAATMDIVQEISYTEIPLELKYAVLNKKIGINAYGGLSVKFLDKNLVFAKTPDGQTFQLGETKNLSGNSYSINLGLGVDYKFTRRLRFNLEPIFKFHLSDYKSFGKMKPYTIGALSGLQFSLHK